MIKIPNSQLSKNYLPLTAILLVPLFCLFVFAIFFERAYFNILAASLLACLVYLVCGHLKLSQKFAETQMQVQDILERRNLVEAEIKKEVQSIDSYRKKILNYSKLKGLTERLSFSPHLQDTITTLSSETDKLLGGDEVTTILYLFQSKTGELGLLTSQKGQMQVNIKSKKGDIFDQWVVRAMQPLLVENAKSDFRFDMDKMVQEEPRLVRSVISAPLMIGHKALGIIRVDSPQENFFNTEDLRFLTTISDLGAIAIESAQLFEHVEQLAIKDSLTGLYLKRYLLDRLQEETARQVKSKSELSFLMIDLDKFKQYNDKYGHAAGDIVLRTLALLLQEFFKDPGNLICRYGGEEFCILLPDCSKSKAVQLAQNFRKKVEEQIIILRRENTSITISVGVASFPKDAHSKEELIQKADAALYEAKNSGRNRVCEA